MAKLKEVGTLSQRVCVRSSKYLNNLIEQDHRRIKQRIRPMLGFKRFETAAVTIRGIELAEKIKKHQFNLKPLIGKETPLRKLGQRCWPHEICKAPRQTKAYTYRNLHQSLLAEPKLIIRAPRSTPSADTVNITAGPQLPGNLVERCISVLTPLTTSNDFVFVTSRLASP